VGAGLGLIVDAGAGTRIDRMVGAGVGAGLDIIFDAGAGAGLGIIVDTGDDTEELLAGETMTLTEGPRVVDFT